MFKTIYLTSYADVRDYAMNFLVDNWDFKTERIFRLPHNEIYEMLNRECTSLNMPNIAIWSIFARGRGQQQIIHSDCAYNGDRVNSAIILPITGTQGSRFQWFSDKEATLKKISTPDSKSSYYAVFYETVPEPIAELEILNPTIINVRNPHRAIASQSLPRAIISMKFEGNPDLLL